LSAMYDIKKCGKNCRIFDDMLIDAVLGHCWLHVHKEATRLLFLNAAGVLISTAFFSYASRQEKLPFEVFENSSLLLFGLFGLSMWMLSSLPEILASRRISGASKWWFSYWWDQCRRSEVSLHEHVIPYYLILVPLALFFLEDPGVNVYARHPLFGAALVAILAHRFVLKLLCLRVFGKNVVPAYLAICSQESVSFMLLLLLNYLISFFVFFTFPVQSDFDGDDHKRFWSQENVIWSLSTMFRLDFSGDFDLGDMEGMNPTITGKINRTTGDFVDVAENNALPHPVIGHGVLVLYMLCTTVITLLFLNVYIGILSNKYDNFYEDRSAHFMSFRLDYTYRLLSRRAMMEQLCPRLCSPKKKEKDDKLIWLAYRVDYENYRSKSRNTDTLAEKLGDEGDDDDQDGR